MNKREVFHLLGDAHCEAAKKRPSPDKAEAILASFHATAAAVFKLHDEYFCGIRADHFVVEFGWSEDFVEQIDLPESPGRAVAEPDEDTMPLEYNPACVVVTANHKGARNVEWFPVYDDRIIKWFDALDASEAYLDDADGSETEADADNRGNNPPGE